MFQVYFLQAPSSSIPDPEHCILVLLQLRVQLLTIEGEGGGGTVTSTRIRSLANEGVNSYLAPPPHTVLPICFYLLQYLRK
jgi:hypothetical protein